MTTEKGKSKSDGSPPGARPGAASRVVLEFTQHVDAPEQKVWDALTDWEHQSTWMLGTRVRATADDGHGVGGRVEAWTGFGRIGFLDTMVITAWEPPNRCEVDHTGRLIRGTGAFLVGPAPSGGSVLTWIESFTVPGGALGRLGWLVVRPAVRSGLRLSLRRLAASVEQSGSVVVCWWKKTYPAESGPASARISPCPHFAQHAKLSRATMARRSSAAKTASSASTSVRSGHAACSASRAAHSGATIRCARAWSSGDGPSDSSYISASASATSSAVRYPPPIKSRAVCAASSTSSGSRSRSVGSPVSVAMMQG
ncbi:MAG TPA: SRPBCC family protein [Actinocrinis sp.]